MGRGDITRELIALREGRDDAMGRLFELVYERLRRMSRARLGGGGSRITLDTSALVHEAYLKLVDSASADWRDRDHFFAVAAKAMRQILIDHVRARQAVKRGGDLRRTDLAESKILVEDRCVELLELNEALDQLEQLNERLCRVVELKFFGGLTFEEIASVLKLNERTVRRDWRKARAFLFRALRTVPDGEPEDPP